ncbi:hypothetical protein V6Z12_D08G207800 [Gossypium hirsutum]
MAYSTALRRVPVSTLFSKLANLSPARTVSVAFPTVARSFNTNAQLTKFNDEDRSVDVQRQSDRSVSRRRDSPRFFSDVFDPFSPTRSLSQVLNLMDQFTDHPLLSTPSLSSRKGWDMREDNNALYIRIEMPGLSKEDVKISVDEIKAEMKNGVLKVVVPKVKEDERKDVYQVTVE